MARLKNKVSPGFTLMEVSILLVIVSILVLIAVPQFQTAEIKSKIALARGQMNTIAIALETYYADNDQYPPTANSSPKVPAVAIDGKSNRTSYYTLLPLTTPISYISKIPEDPFANVRINSSFDEGYGRFGHYNAGYSFRHAKGTGQPTLPYFRQYDEEWMLSSVGPDKDYDAWGTGQENLMFYDPSNGVLSNGDIIRFQKGGMRD